VKSAIQEEPFHREWLKPEFFYHPSGMSMIVSDDQGFVCVLRMQPRQETLYLFLQFISHDPKRNTQTIVQGFPVVKENARKSGFKEIQMDSVSRPLVTLCRRKLGFKHIPFVPDHYFLSLGA
jgi:hypothetical protein